MAVTATDEEPDVDKTRSGRLTRMDELRSQAMSAETGRRRKLELARIESALRRLEEGEFGYCSVCGEAIAAGRLGVDPAAECCIRCATQAEQRR
jgi:DnaK suppressor protein